MRQSFYRPGARACDDRVCAERRIILVKSRVAFSNHFNGVRSFSQRTQTDWPLNRRFIAPASAVQPPLVMGVAGAIRPTNLRNVSALPIHTHDKCRARFGIGAFWFP